MSLCCPWSAPRSVLPAPGSCGVPRTVCRRTSRRWPDCRNPLQRHWLRSLTQLLQKAAARADTFVVGMAHLAASQVYGRKVSTGINWVTVIAMTIYHIGTVAAFFYFDWGAL